MPEPASDAPKSADAYPIGIVFDVVFDAFTARLTTLPDGQIRFEIAKGPYAKTETVKIAASRIRTGVFAVSWVEASGATVVHVEDFEHCIVHSYATLPDGSFLRMQGPIHLISRGKVR
ncbi:MoaF-related domain-containing protein [Sphingomonas sanxanigenens]|uniref:MoaF-related domain-containing protein n=1 Tax=Sphingomonas sanxanigenens TaxID=397260 RepID=UPI0004B921AE|nr:adenylate cyclase [Sphingomonas sanxanigenens]